MARYSPGKARHRGARPIRRRLVLRAVLIVVLGAAFALASWHDFPDGAAAHDHGAMTAAADSAHHHGAANGQPSAYAHDHGSAPAGIGTTYDVAGQCEGYCVVWASVSPIVELVNPSAVVALLRPPWASVPPGQAGPDIAKPPKSFL